MNYEIDDMYKIPYIEPHEIVTNTINISTIQMICILSKKLYDNCITKERRPIYSNNIDYVLNLQKISTEYYSILYVTLNYIRDKHIKLINLSNKYKSDTSPDIIFYTQQINTIYSEKCTINYNNKLLFKVKHNKYSGIFCYNSIDECRSFCSLGTVTNYIWLIPREEEIIKSADRDTIDIQCIGKANDDVPYGIL